MSEGPNALGRSCSRCGAPLPADAPKGVCPQCELLGALNLIEQGSEKEPRTWPSAPRGTADLPGGDADTAAGNDPRGGDTDQFRPRSFGNYELLEEIARGGMGVVYKARQRGLDRIVAVKMILVEQFAGKQSVQRFRGEAAAAGVLQHPNIVAIHEIGMHEGQHFFSMDFVEGQNLAQLVGHRPLPALRAARYLQRIAEAVHYAHEQGILHRDLKPSNVLIDAATDQPRITDFGLAKRFHTEHRSLLTDHSTGAGCSDQSSVISDQSSDLTVSGQVLGSPNFMPPEQASRGRGKVGRHSDVFGLGAILYFLLTARAPFQGESLEATISQVLNVEPVPPRLLNPGVPPDLETICLKCLEKEPARRYATAQQLADELGRFLADRPILARPVSRAEKVLRWGRRNPVMAALAATAVIIFLLGFAGVTWQGQRAARAAAETRVQRDLAQGHLYAAQMKLVHAACQEGRLGRALELLRAQRPTPGQRDFRGFDWGFLYRLCLGPSEVLATNASGITSMDLSPDGRTLALGSGDGMVELFEAQTWQRVAQWPAHRGLVASLAFGGRKAHWLATVSGDDGLLKLWDLATQRVFFETNSLRGFYSLLRVSPSGRFLVAPTPFTPFELSLNLWEVLPSPQGGPPTVRLNTNLPGLGPAAFSPDDRTLALCNQPPFEFIVSLYDLAKGTTRVLGRAHSDGISCVAFSPDGNRLATGSSDERVVLWDLTRGGTHRVLQSGLTWISSVAFSADSQTLFAGCLDQSIHSWQLEETASAKVLAGHSAPISALAVAPDGGWLVSASGDGTARLWSLKGKAGAAVAQPTPEFRVILHPADTFSPARGPAGVWGAAVSPNQSRVAAVADERLLLCDLNTGAVLAKVAATNVFPVVTATNQFRSATFSPDGSRLAVGSDDGRVAFLEADSLRPLTAPTNLHPAQVTDIAYALDGAVLVTAGGFGAGITLTEVGSGRVITNFSAVDEGFYPLNPLAVSPDGKRLATGSPDRAIRIRDIATGQVLATCPHQARFPGCLAFSPDGRLLAFTDLSGSLYLWDTSGRQPLRRRSGHSGGVAALAFSPEGTLASGGTDHTIRLWHPELDQEAVILTGHTGWVLCLGFAEHGNALVSGSMDGTLRIWRALSLEQIAAQERAGVVSRPK